MDIMSSPGDRAKRIAITGCTGFVGSQIVPLLEQRGATLLLVGRSRERILGLFPGRDVCTYADLADCGQRYDLIVHLAALNNDQHADDAKFHEVNVTLALRVAEAAAAAGIGAFVNVSSFHALDHAAMSPYARSKKAAVDALSGYRAIPVTNLYLPAVYGDRLAGRMRRLNALPFWLAGPLFSVLAALRPTVHAVKIVQMIGEVSSDKTDRELLIADDQDENPFYRFAMRMIDLTFAVAVALAFGWLMLLCWALIRIESRGPGIFAQTRVGRFGRPFVCYKFRTMKDGTRQAASHEVSQASVTGMGNFLRKSKIDELPQIWNIFRNEISLVGPRPCLPVQSELIAERGRRGVLTMKPGITGYAQIRHVDMSDPERLAKLDARYKMLRSVPLNIKIIIATFLGRGRGDRVAR